MRKTQKRQEKFLKKRHASRWGFMLLAIGALLMGLIAGGIFFYQQGHEKVPANDLTIAGDAVVHPWQAVAYIHKHNPDPRLNCSVEDLVSYYYAEAMDEGIRPDVALCQAIKETGCFAYGKDVLPEQNNYCGLGTTGGGVHGCYFGTPREGIRAHIQHLKAYSSPQPPLKSIVDPRYALLKEKHPEIFGQIATWAGLDGKWAVPGTNYGEEILHIWKEMQAITTAS